MPRQTNIQITGRNVHTSNSGIEIIREFNVEPYSHYPQVLKELQGYIKDDKRVPPAQDPYIDVCYCTEARAEQWHEDQMTTSENLEVISRAVNDGIQKVTRVPAFTNPPSERIRKLLQMNREEPEEGTAGARITAIYRPLVTAWDSDDGPSSRWDWLDPIVEPGVREIPWPLGLSIRADAVGPDVRTVPNSVANPLRVSIDDVYVRRILVPKIPNDKIQQAVGCLNRETFPVKGTPPADGASGFPQCRPRTLLFVGAKVQNMMDSDGHRWFEIRYHFQHLIHWSTILMDNVGNPGEGWVTWNHVFIRPYGAKLGWYPVHQNEQRELTVLKTLTDMLPFMQLRAGLLMNEANFSPLFEL